MPFNADDFAKAQASRPRDWGADCLQCGDVNCRCDSFAGETDPRADLIPVTMSMFEMARSRQYFNRRHREVLLEMISLRTERDKLLEILERRSDVRSD